MMNYVLFLKRKYNLNNNNLNNVQQGDLYDTCDNVKEGDLYDTCDSSLDTGKNTIDDLYDSCDSSMNTKKSIDGFKEEIKDKEQSQLEVEVNEIDEKSSNSDITGKYITLEGL